MQDWPKVGRGIVLSGLQLWRLGEAEPHGLGPHCGAGEIIAQNEEEPRPEEAADPLAAVRRQMWRSDLATLREIDPANPQLFVLTAPGWTPRQEDLDRLDAAIRSATIRRVLDRILPNGVPIGTAGRRSNVRELPGGLAAARTLFDYLRVGGQILADRLSKSRISGEP